jgi:transposase
MSWTVAVGVDTHKHVHAVVVLDRLGRELGRRLLAVSASGYLELLEWVRSLGVPAFAIEGTGCYGAGLTRLLLAEGLVVFEVERPGRQERRKGKSDLLDAERAARRLLAGDGLAVPRASGGEQRELLRALLVERSGAERARTAALNQLQALVVTAPAGLRERLDGLRGERLGQRVVRLRSNEPLAPVLRRLGQRIGQLSDELARVDQELAAILRPLAPELLDEYGVGPFVAAQLIVSSADPTRMRSEPSFASLSGTNPIPASSGQHQRHRLNRGGDRQLNRALHVTALTRIRGHQETRDYYQRLQDRGKSKREAIRCIKRTLARRFYRLLTTNPQLAHASTRQT